MVQSKEELQALFRDTFAEDTRPEITQLIENTFDTISDIEDKANTTDLGWKQKYEDLDKSWATKYRERFYSGSDPEQPNKPDKGAEKVIKINDLFSRKD